MVMLTDQHNQLLYANPPARRYFRLPPGDGFALRPYLTISPVETTWEALYQQLQQGENSRSLFMHTQESQEDFLEIQLIPLAHQQILSITREITQQKKKEARWTEQRLKEEALSSFIPDAYFLIGRNYGLLDFNTVGAEWFQSIHQLSLSKGTDIRSLPVMDLPQYVEAFEDALKGEKKRITHRIALPDRPSQTVNFAFAPVRNAAEEIWAVMVLTQDVSPLQDLQQDIQTFRQRLDNFSRALPGCLYEYDVNTRTDHHWFTYVSEGAYDLLGFEPEHLTQSPATILERIEPFELERVQAGILRAARGRLIWEDVFPYQHPDGQTRWVFGRSRPQAQGDHVLFSGVLLDITDAELARRALRDQEEQNRAILTAMPDAIFQIFQDGRLRDIKPGNDLQRLTIKGNTLEESDFPDDLKVYLKQAVNDALATRETHHLEFDYQRPTGEYISYEIRLIASGQDSVLCVIRNVTELHSLTRQLQESQHTLLAMLENSGDDSIWYVNQNLELIMANQSYLHKMTQTYRHPLVKGDSILRVLARNHPEEAALWQAHYQEALSGKKVRREYQEVNYLGEISYMECFFNPVFTTGRVVGCVCLSRNITEFKKVEQSLKQVNLELEHRVEERTAQLRQSKEQAEAANFAKTGFLANISHEVRTPIHAVLGYGEMIEMALRKDVDLSEIQDYARSIRKSAQTLLILINDLLDLSQLESGAMANQPEPLALKNLCEEVVAMFRPRAQQKKLNLELSIQSDVPPFVQIDPVRSRQILMNLLGNAVKFTHEGYVRLSVDHDAEYLLLCVEDSGIGISAGSFDTIFDPFVQQEGQLTRDYGGTGLGLSITQRLVHLMQGHIQVESTPGKGSRFQVALPLQWASQAQTDASLSHSETPPESEAPSYSSLLGSQLSLAQLRSLEKTFEMDYLKTLHSYSFDRTSAFARRLHSWALVYEFQPLMDLSHDLLNAVGRFDIEKMTLLLSHYAQWIEGMKGESNE